MSEGYIHGRDPSEVERLREQAEFAGPILLEGVAVPSGRRRVLDLGCGVGAMTRLLIDRGASAPVGVDRSIAQAREARRLAAGSAPALGPDFAAADGALLPFRDASFDLVYTSWLLEHVPCPIEVLREARRVLAPGGVFWSAEVENASLIVWPGSAALEEAWRAFNQAQLAGGGDPSVGRKLYPLLAGAGFRRADVRPHTFHAHAGRPAELVAVVREFTGILRSGREAVLRRGAVDAATYDRAVRDLASLPERPGGTFTYTFLRGCATR